MRRWWAPAAVAAVLVAAWFAAWYSSVSVTKLPSLQLSQPPQVDASQPLRPAVTTPESKGHSAFDDFLLVLLYVGLGILVLGVLAVVGYLIWLWLRSLDRTKPRLLVWRDRPEIPAQRGDEVEMLAAVEAGLAELSDTDADPRRAVIACWVRLERAAAAAGTPRAPGDSPTDLVARLLGAHQVSRPVLSALARVYREARFTTHPIDQRMRQTAVDALSQVRAELASEVTADGA
jgi:hypothetical protein